MNGPKTHDWREVRHLPPEYYIYFGPVAEIHEGTKIFQCQICELAYVCPVIELKLIKISCAEYIMKAIMK